MSRLVLSAGGQQGVAYIGVVQALERHFNCRCLNQHYSSFEGTSAGAMTAFLLSLGFTSLELLLHYQRAPVYCPDMAKLPRNFGLADMRTFLHKVIVDALRSRGISGDEAEKITFRRLQEHTKKRLVIGITVIGRDGPNGSMDSDGEYDASVDNSPEWPVVDCLMASMAIPPLFGPVSIRVDDKTTVYAVDGAMANGFRFGYQTKDDSELLGILLKPERSPSLVMGYSPRTHSVLQYLMYMCELHFFFVASQRGKDIKSSNVITIRCTSAAGTIYQPDANAMQELIAAGEKQTQDYFVLLAEQKRKADVAITREMGNGFSGVASGKDSPEECGER